MRNKNKLDQWREYEYKDEWIRSIRNKCFLCEIRIKNCVDYYLKYGNCCIVCSSRITKKAIDYKHNEMMLKILTDELIQRRRLVKMGILIEQSAKYI